MTSVSQENGHDHSHELSDEVSPELMQAFIDAPPELNERLYQGATRSSDTHEADVAQELENFDAGMQNGST
jgi:hypothetical protein